MNRLLCGALGIGASLLVSCTVEPKAPDAPEVEETQAPPVVLTVNYPLYYFASQIAGNTAEVEFPVPADVDPAYWKPERDDIQRFQEADLIILNGADYAKWAKAASLPEDKTVTTTDRFTDQLIETAGETHSHGPEGEHAHHGTDFNTWLDPILAMKQANAVRNALLEVVAGGGEAIYEHTAKVEEDLQRLDARLTVVSEDLSERPLLASHPVYDYLARRYNWNLKSMHWEPGDVPVESDWVALDELLKEHPAELMLWEAEPHAATRAMLEERGIEVIVFYPCGNRPPEGDYMEAMEANVGRLQEAVAALAEQPVEPAEEPAPGQ